ncbi:nitrilase-related carbon-nitrogen hydrolase [Collinsella tanakaei]|uniref:nitrilase-related carbon-nitrogen hydrolase n=1 Tax=Collinsella tanakaei TaxID=626935 RepID=UPI00195ADE60|nr:nitrilase-related carbon-nitrogen hydrolase [Collinsella tanakaei]MBM6866993.1 hypothetical protein [Collinsella tanakaei]
MKLALAQIDVRLGDIEGICSRIGDQAVLASSQGAQLLCCPTPMFCGMQPTSLIEYPNYLHDLLRCLSALAERLEDADISCLVPAIVPIGPSPFLETFLVREGRVVPLRSLIGVRHGNLDVGTWESPVFDIDGARVAVVLELERDLPQLPRGCDVAVYLPLGGFNAQNEQTSAVAAVADGYFSEAAARAGVWLAYMAPVGAYDDVVYTGGSFVMDEAGRVVAASPCFEEDLLVQEVVRGSVVPAIDTHELPSFQREEWVWEALRLHLRDTVEANGYPRIAMALEGDLPSSLLAVLAVDAVGSRNVIGVAFERSEVFTPQQEAAECERMERVRQLAANLGIRLVERAQGDVSRWMDRDVPARDAGRLRAGIDALYLSDVAHELDACIVTALTKTDAAIAPDACVRAGAPFALVAPFGDVYLTYLEFLARYRSRTSAAIPAGLISLASIRQSMDRILFDAADVAGRDPIARERIAQIFARLEPAQIDGALEAHVDRNQTLEDIPLSAISPKAVSLLMLMTRRGEQRRRSLPMTPFVSERSFSERVWPATLGWSDLGRGGEDPLSLEGFVAAEQERLEELGEEHGERVRGEILGLLGDLLGLSPDQQQELMSEEGQRRMRESAMRFESQLRQMMESAGEDEMGGAGPAAPPSGGAVHHYPFFSQN